MTSPEQETNDLKQRIQQARKAGYSDMQIFQKLRESEQYSPKFAEARDAGYSSEEIYGQLFDVPMASKRQIDRRLNAPEESQPQGTMENFGKALAYQAQAIPDPETQKVTGKALASGGTFGLTENIPGMALTEEQQEDYGDLIDIAKTSGELMATHALFGMYSKLGPKFLQTVPGAPNYVKSLVRIAQPITESGATGASVSALKQLGEGKMPSPSEVLAHGAEWAALDGALQAAGMGVKFAKAAFRKVEQTGKPFHEVVNETLQGLRKKGIDYTNVEEFAKEALEGVESLGKGKSLEKGRVTKPKPETAPEGQKVFARPKAPEGEGKAVTGRGKAPEKQGFREPAPFIADEVENEVARHAPRWRDKKTFGEAVKGNITKATEEAFQSYGPKYDAVKPTLRKIKYERGNTEGLVLEAFRELKSLKTKPSGYGAAETRMTEILEDLGWKVSKDSKGALIGITPPKDTKLNLDDAIMLSRRIGELADFEGLEPSVKKKFNAIQKALKEDAKSVLKSKNPRAYDTFEKAEREYESLQNKKRRQSINKIRGLEETENIADIIEKPTVLEDLRNILSEKDFKEVEREFFESMKDMKPEKAEKLLRETRNYLTEDGAKIAEKIVQEKQLNGFIESLFKGGKIDFAKASKAMNEPKTRKLIEEVGGKGAVSFFENLESTNKQIEANLNKSIRNAKLSEKISKKTGSDIGKEKIARRKAENVARQKEGTAPRIEIEQVSKEFETAKPGKAVTPRKSETGKDRLERSVNKAIERAQKSRNPARKFIEDASKITGLSPKVMAYVTAAAFGGKGLTIFAGLQVTRRLMKSPKARQMYREILKASRKDPRAFIMAVDQFSKEVEED